MKKYSILGLCFIVIFAFAKPVFAVTGDVTGDGNVDLSDSVRALQIVVSTDLAGQAINSDADVNNDGKIGMAEAVYALQVSAGLQPTATGVVKLPDGFALPPTSLTVTSAMNTVPVGSDGKFTVIEPAGGGAATVLLTDANGNVIMLGHVDTDNPAFNEISPATTAVEILFLSTGSFALPRTSWPDVYRILAAAPETATLAGVISTRMIASSTAVEDMDPVIVDAINAAVTSLMNPQSPLAGGSSGSGGALAAILPTRLAGAAPPRQASEPADVTGELAVKTTASDDTPNPGWGMVTEASDDRHGIKFTNYSRIHRYYFIYRTGRIPSTGKMTDPPEKISPWETVASGFLPAVNGVNGGLTTTLYDYTSGALWHPEGEHTIPLLPLSPADAVANTYQVYVVGMGEHKIADPADLKLNADAALVRKTMKDMTNYEGFKEFLWPLITKVLTVSSKTDIWENYVSEVAAINEYLQELGTVGLEWMQQIANNPEEVWPASKILFKAIIGSITSETGKDALLAVITKLTKNSSATVVDNVQKFGKFAGKLAAVVKVTDAILAGVDLGMTTHQISESNDYNIWTVFAAASAIALSPTNATLTSSQQTAPFSVKVSGYLPIQLKYVWGPSTYGKFQNPTCGSGNPLNCLGSQAATYSLTDSAHLPKVASDTFPVNVLDPNGLSIGTLTGVVNFGNVVIKPYTNGQNFFEGAQQTFTVSLTTGAIPAGTNITWSITPGGTTTGTLNGGTGPVTSSSPMVNYVAPMVPVSDLLEVQLTDKKKAVLGHGGTLINVVSGLIISPDTPVSLGGQQDFTVSGTNGFVLPANAVYRWTVKGTGTLSGGNPTITTTPTVTYIAPSDVSTKDTLTVQVIDQGKGKVVAQESLFVRVGVITWTGTSHSITDPDSLKIEDWTVYKIYEYQADPAHVYFEGTSKDSHNATYNVTCGDKTSPATFNLNGDGTHIISTWCFIDSTSYPYCTANIPSVTMTQSPTGLNFPGATYTWSHDCSDAVTVQDPFTLHK